MNLFIKNSTNKAPVNIPIIIPIIGAISKNLVLKSAPAKENTEQNTRPNKALVISD